MATNKNQHFVPRVHFRPFSVDGQGNAIHLFNIDRARAIANAPLKGQCSGDYFYGEDLRIEKAMQAFESRYGTMVEQVRHADYRLDDDHRAQLRDFWCLQHLRTEHAARRQVQLIAETSEVAGLTGERFRMSIREAVEGAVALYEDARRTLDDLKVCLVRNTTDLAFVTSDDPAVMTNRWHLMDSRARGMAPGLVSAGALMLLPLSPEILALIYDGDVYSVGHLNGWVAADRRSDVEAFNQHQMLNGFANIYFRSWHDRHDVEAAARVAGPLRPAARHRINYLVYDRQEGTNAVFRPVDHREASSHERAMIHQETILPVPSSWPRQIAWRPQGRVYSNGTGTGFVRRSWVDIDGGPPYARLPARRTRA